jgi:hypothetical protein
MGQQEGSPYLLFQGSIYKTMLSMGTPWFAHGDIKE